MREMERMQWILLLLLLCSGYFAVARGMLPKTEKGRSGPAAVVLLVVYCLFAGIFCLIIRYAMGDGMLLMAVLLPMAFGMVMAAGRWLMKSGKTKKLPVAVLFAAYVLVMGYVTLFSREASSGLDIRLDFVRTKEALQQASLLPMRHVLQNVVMFMPLGFLLPLMEKEKRFAALSMLAAALFFTAGIESVQLIAQIGQVDVEDLAANMAGAAAGYILWKCILGRSEE